MLQHFRLNSLRNTGIRLDSNRGSRVVTVQVIAMSDAEPWRANLIRDPAAAQQVGIETFELSTALPGQAAW